MVGLDGGRIVLQVVMESQLFASGMRVWMAITVEATTERVDGWHHWPSARKGRYGLFFSKWPVDVENMP